MILNLLCEENIVNDLLVLDEALILLHDFSPRSPFLDPSKEKDEAVDRAFQRLLQIIDLFHLDALHAEVFQEQREQACIRVKKVLELCLLQFYSAKAPAKLHDRRRISIGKRLTGIFQS